MKAMYVFVNDENMILNALRRVLSRGRKDMVFVCCSSTDEAVAATSNLDPKGVLFCDIDLTATGGEGIEVAQRLRERSFTIVSMSTRGIPPELKELGITESLDPGVPKQFAEFIAKREARSR